MSNPDDGRSNVGSGTTWSIAILALLLLYPLSIGPVAKILKLTYGNHPPPPAAVAPLEIIYKPLFAFVNNSEPAKRFYEWYFKLWGL